MTQLTVGKLAKAGGIGVETVRYYEKRCLLPEPERLPSGYRVYSEETINRVRFIKRAQELGFTLEEISELLALTDNLGADCADIRDRAQDKITEIKGKMNDWMFGCDICQDVCPWNRFSKPHKEPAFEPHEKLGDMRSDDWHELTEELFREIFKGSAVKRTKFSGLKRNIDFIKS